MRDETTVPHGDQVGRPSRRFILAGFFSLLALAAIVRLPLLNNGLFTSLPVREYRAALISRTYYLESNSDAPEWQVALAVANRDREGFLEPPLMEWFVAQAYRLLGGERLWVPRLLSALAWLAGGIFLFLFARRLTSPLAALVALAYYLFLPTAIHLSISFQPDALMIFLFLGALYFLLRHHDSGVRRHLLFAACFSSLALLIKPLVLHMIFAAFAALALARRPSWRALFGGEALLFTAVSLAPAAIYYGYGFFGAGFLGAQVEMSFIPRLLLEPTFWRGWLLVGVGVLGAGALALAMLGASMIDDATTRMMLAGLGIGYVLFGLTFTHHIHTHGYYQLQAIPLVGILLSLPIDRLLRTIAAQQPAALRWVPVVGAAILLLLLNIRTLRGNMAAARVEPVAVAQAIGETVNHSDRVVYVAYGYGNALAYNGMLFGTFWPRPDGTNNASADPAGFPGDARFAALGFTPQYYVVTDFEEYFTHHDDLRRYLETDCRLLSDDARYLTYGQCRSSVVGK